MDLVEAEVPAQMLELLREDRESPVDLRTVRASAAELVVHHHRPLVRQPFERTEVVVRRPRPAVQADERRPPSLAGDAVPRAAERALEEALHGTSLRKRLGTLCRLPS